MAGTTVEIDTKEVFSLSNMLSGMELSSEDRSELLSELGVEAESQTQERFDTKVAPDGIKWNGIAEATRAYYAKQHPGARPPLVVSGSLRDTIESQKKGSWEVLVGATKEYAAVHQYGFKKRNIPARPFLGVSLDDEADLAAITRDFIIRRTR